MTYETGEVAERIVDYVADHPFTTPTEIRRALGVDEHLLYMALGWLAHEDRLIYSSEGRCIRLSLADK